MTVLAALYHDAAGTTQVDAAHPLLSQQSTAAPNPNQEQIYLIGLAGTTLQAMSDPGVDPIQASIVDAVSAWAANTVQAVDALVKPTVDNLHYYIATVAGTTDATTEPTWPTDGSTVVDGTVTWQDAGPSQPVTALKLALTQAGLATAVAGDPLILGTDLVGGLTNAIPFWAEIDEKTLARGTYTNLSLVINTLIEQ